jgi:hypothetical protein
VAAREGGCLCGAVRFRARGEPSRTVVCHCQRATGSALGLWPTYAQDNVRLEGELSFHEHRSDESGRWIRLNFCPRCGTTVTSAFEMGPGEVAILGGTFDDTKWLRVDRHVWTRSKQHWLPLPEGASVFEKSSRGS